MQRIPISLARQGMKLAKEVRDGDGKVLCGAGVELSTSMIERLARSGVHAVTVEGHPVNLPGEKSLAEQIRDLEYRFSRVKDDPVLRAVSRTIAEHLVEEYSKM
ncbi:MAG: hypothetical protein K6360_01540 [Deltaproteobacteria bacterium]